MKVVQVRAYFVHGIADRVVRGGDAMPLQEFLGETLAGFQLGRRFGGAEGAPAAAGEFVHHSEHQGQFGTDHCEIGLDLAGDAGERVQAFDVSGKAFRFFGDPAISGRAVDLRHARRLPQLPDQRVLAPSTADD